MKTYLSNSAYLILVLFVLLQFSCDSHSKINGYVYDSDNQPIKNATVQFSVAGVKENKELFQKNVKTDETGSFGVYVGHGPLNTDLRLVVAKDGYKIFVLETTARDLIKDLKQNNEIKIILEKQEN
jgi:hypothetical protein